MFENFLKSMFLLSFILSFSQEKAMGVPTLIPKKINGKYGYVNQLSKVIIKPDYKLAMFFSEDCNLLNSPNLSSRKFGTKNYATVEKDNVLYRINKLGKRVKRITEKDLGPCQRTFVEQPYLAFRHKTSFGVVTKPNVDVNNNDDFVILPTYQLIHIMEGKDINNPMIVAVRNNKFGVINKRNEVIIPFIYEDIKRNFSWKIANLFEVTKDGKEYFYIDDKNKKY